jgi:Concanavalin A-like lectin/glucanases superfamily
MVFSILFLRFTTYQARIAVAAVVWLGSGAAEASGFYAYYTRLAYPDASEVALPGRALTGKYADVVVQLAAGRFVFSRENGYLPRWEVGTSKWPAPEIVARRGDGPSTRPDNINRASYVRIIESSATQVVVHWHYAPDLLGSHFTGFQSSYNGSPGSYCQDFVEEVFTIKSDGTVTRTVRSSLEKIDAYHSPSNLTVQTFSLKAGGISSVTTQPAVPQDTTPAATSGAPIKSPPVVSPALWWKFDDGMSTRPLARKYLTQENVTAADCIISGNAAIWQQGVSGTCLAFDGYTSVVTLPAARAPDVSAGVTVEAWVAPQEYANSSAAIVDHSGGTANGYSLHMDFLGHLVFRVQAPSGWKTLTTSVQLPLLKWAHVAAVYDPASGLEVYINGASAGTLAATGTLVDAAATDIRIGMSHKKEAPSATVREFGQSFLSNVVFDGLIDEVRIYDRPLSGSEISSNRTALIPVNPQPLQYRVMPSGTPDGTFGARYEKLAYTPAWDNLWRVGDHPDIVVGFDQHPVRMVFWRGTSYGLSTVSENGIWVSDQSPENWTEGPSYAEHMSDKHCRFSHVRLIENTPARVIVHWRVASSMIDYQFLTTKDPWGDWTDEYDAIYPDGVAVRYQEVRANTPGRLGEVIQHEMLNQAGTRPEDNANDQMIVVANMNGETRRYDWSGGAGAVSLDPAIANGNIEYMNLKADYKHYIIGEVGSTWSPFGLWNPSYSRFSCWNHWPVSMVPDDHRNTRWPDRPSSSCVGNLYPVRRNVGAYQQQVMNLYGLTNRPAADLAPLAKSWAQAPAIQALTDCQGAAYVPAERAYHFTANGAAPSVRIAASAASPIANLCLVVKEWTSLAEAPARLLIDGVAQTAGPNFRQGIVRDTTGKPMLVVWVERAATTPVTFTLLTKRD